MYTKEEFKNMVETHSDLIIQEMSLKQKIMEKQALNFDFEARTALDKQELSLYASDTVYRNLVDELAKITAKQKALYYKLKYTETYLNLKYTETCVNLKD